MDSDPIVAVKDLCKTYASGFRALKNVSLDIRRSEMFALLGPNGAGKTTLISIVCGIVTPTAGAVFADGHDIVRDYRAARSRIGLVPQELTTDAFESVWNTAITWTGTKPTLNFGTGTGVFIPFHSRTSGSFIAGFTSSTALKVVSSKLTWLVNSGERPAGTTSLPTGANKFSVGANWDNDLDLGEYFYGTEAGSLAADGTGTGNAGSTASLEGLGGQGGQGNCVAGMYGFFAFNRTLTEAEYQSLHNDWYNVLTEDVGGGPTTKIITLAALETKAGAAQ